MEKKTPILDFIVTHYDEPWETGKKFFDILSMQRDVNFDDIRVILVHDGHKNVPDLDIIQSEYPFRIKLVESIDHVGPAKARNMGLRASDAEWVMFCDFDDMFSDVVSVKCILNVLPTRDADIIWMDSYREQRIMSAGKPGMFVNCLKENFCYTHGKLYRREVLVDNDIRFDDKLRYWYEKAFNHLALALVPPYRVMHLEVSFTPYLKTLRDDSYTVVEDTLSQRIESLYDCDISLVDEYRKRDRKEYYDVVAATIFDAYYLLGAKPQIKGYNRLMRTFTSFYNAHKKDFESIRFSELEIILDNCTNGMLKIVQDLYNYYGIEAEPPYEGMDNITRWLKTIDNGTTETKHTSPAPVTSKSSPAIPMMSEPYNGPRVVVYCGTANTYPNMIASAKSLLANTHVDKVYFLTEDDEFPEELPDIITNINVKDQTMFPEKGPNFANSWSYMCLMRAAFPLMFHEYDRILSLDIDVVINEDISHMWDIDLSDYYFAGVPEPSRQRKHDDPVYCNFGVIMMNISKLRHDNKVKDIIAMLNSERLGCPEQDAFNKVCANHILALPPDYNYTPYSNITGVPKREIITHYAGIKYWKHFQPVRKYADMSWGEIVGKDENTDAKV